MKKLGVAFLFICLVGLVDATYLTQKHYSNIIPPCTINGCEIVLASSYSEVVGVPLSLFGIVYYLTLLTLIIMYMLGNDDKFLLILSEMTPVGFSVSLYLVYLQLFVIEELCQYCVISAITSTLLFIMGVYVLWSYYKKSA